MKEEAKQIATHIRIGLVHSMRATYRSARDHPLIWGVLLLLLLLYRSFPSLFAFLVSSSPVIACTTLLLGLLLSYGEPNLPEIEENRTTHQASSLKVWTSAGDLVAERDGAFAVEAHVERDSLVEEDEERHVHDPGFVEEREFSVEKRVEGAVEVGRDVHGVFADDQKDIVGARELGQDVAVAGVSVDDRQEIMDALNVDIGRPASEENRFDSSLGSPWQPINKDDTSTDSESDGAESSSPDASMADIIPMLDELHPLLDSEDPQPVLKSIDDSDAGSAEEEAEHHGEDEEDEEAHEEKADADEEAVKWTADDQKNVMVLGISEIERNRRLESLIARRQARKNLRFITERNLIDLDPVPAADDLIGFQAQIPPISAPRQNPFDLPYDSNETTALPPIPGSAPSVMQPRQNPFDLPYDQMGQSSSLTSERLSYGESLSVPHRDMFFRRYESFSLGAPFPGDLNQERPSSKLKPYFVAEMVDDAAFPTFQRQLSEMSDSKVSSVPDSDTASSGIDHEHHRELLEEVLLQENELISPDNHDAEPIEQQSQSSEEVDSVNVDHDRGLLNEGDSHGIDLYTSDVIEETHQTADAFQAVEGEIREGELDSTTSNAAKLEVIEDKYDESSSSSSLEADDKSSRMKPYEESVNLEPVRGDSLKGSGDSMHSLHVDSNVPSREGEKVDDSEAVDPVYDSSPSSIKKSLFNMSLFDEALFDAGKGGLNSSPSLASEKQADILEVGSAPSLLEKSISSERDSESVTRTMYNDLTSISGEFGIASSNLSSTDDELRLRELAGQIMHPLSLSSVHTESIEDSLSSVHTESIEDSPIDADISFESEGGDMTGAASSYSDISELSDHLTSSASEKVHPLIERSVSQPSSEAAPVEPLISLNLPPIPEENLEDFRLEEEHVPVVGLTGLQIIEESAVGSSDIEQELSFLQWKSREKTEDIDNANRLVHEPKDVDASVVSPINSNYDSGITGVHSLGITESMDSSSLLNTAYELLETKSHGASSDSHGDVISEVVSELQDGLPKLLNNSYTESDEIHSEVRIIEGVDEGLLSELDAVGDFRVEEVKSDGVGPQMELHSDGKFAGNDADTFICPVKQQLPSQLEVSHVRSIENTGRSSEATLNDLDELPLVSKQQNAMEWEAGSSSWPTGVDPEMTVYNSKLHVLEACTFEEPDSALKQFHEEAVMPCSPELIIQNSVTTTMDAGSNRTNNTDEDPKLSETDLELQILEAKSIEDINSAFQQLSKGCLDKSAVPDIGPSESYASRMQLEMMEAHSDLQVVDAKSLEDLHLALKQVTDGTAENPLKPEEPNDGSAMAKATERRLESEVLEVQSAEDIRLAFEAAVVRETGSSHELSDEKSHRVEMIADASSSTASTSRADEEELHIL